MYDGKTGLDCAGTRIERMGEAPRIGILAVQGNFREHAAVLRRLGADPVEVLAELDGEPVLLRQGRLLVASFHPELTDDTRVHERFLELVEEGRHVRS